MVTDSAAPGPAYLDALARMARDESLDPAFRAYALRLPSEDDMAQTLHAAGRTPDPVAIHAARERLARAAAEHLRPILTDLHEAMAVPGPYTPDPRTAGQRALRLAALAYLTRLDAGARARKQFAEASNMTEELGALGCLLMIGAGEEALASFARRWSHDRLVMDKWFALQIVEATPETLAETAAALTRHPDFDWKTPNRFRAVLGALPANHAGFHHASGAAYRLLADWLIKLDPVNPQTAARLSTAFETWRRYDADRQGLIRAELARIRATPGLSRDLGEMTQRMLGDA
jgi:aminopeptidase N